jgi:hypothetical protein
MPHKDAEVRLAAELGLQEGRTLIVQFPGAPT